MGLSSVCVYCGSSPGHRPEYAEAASALGRALAGRSIETVYGGGRRGLMGALADAALQAGGRVVGVMPQSLMDMEIAHPGLTEMHIVATMHHRKAMMTSLADAFVILPGAWGTLDELCEALTWAQLNIHKKACVLWNVLGYWDPFLDFLRQAVSEEFLKPKDYARLLVASQLEEVFDAIYAFEPSHDPVPVKVLD